MLRMIAGLLVLFVVSSDVAFAQRGGGRGGGTGGRGGGSAITVPANLIVSTDKAVRANLSLTREQRDSIVKIDTTYVRKEREFRAEASAIVTALPTRAAAANAELLTRMDSLQTAFGAAFRAVLTAEQVPIFEKNLAEFLAKQMEARGRGRGRGSQVALAGTTHFARDAAVTSLQQLRT